MSSTGAPIEHPTFEISTAAYEREFSGSPKWSCWAPGRVSLMGGHVDYNEGLVLPAAIGLGIGLVFRGRVDRKVRIFSADFDASAEFSIEDLRPGSVSGWAAYPAGVAWAMTQAGLDISGLDAALAGNIPIASGLASSAAVEVAFAAAFRRISDLGLPNLELARICQKAENEFVGVRCGIMDQVSSACARADHALLLDCRELAIRHVPLPASVRIVILGTRVKRELRSSEFNRRRRECEEAVSLLSLIDDKISSLRDVRPEDLGRLLRHLPPPLDSRVRHVVGEIERVKLAAEALEQVEMERFGELMFASHRSSRDNYEASSEELDALVQLARMAPGILGARLTGAGFGGCTVNLVAAPLTDEFLRHVAGGYEKLFGREPESFVTSADSGVTVEKLE